MAELPHPCVTKIILRCALFPFKALLCVFYVLKDSIKGYTPSRSKTKT